MKLGIHSSMCSNSYNRIIDTIEMCNITIHFNDINEQTRCPSTVS